MGIGPGNIAAQMPPREDDQVRKQRDLERSQREQAAARSAQAMQVGAGGITVNGGGSITVTDGGSLNILGSGSINVPSGGLNSSGSISAATTIDAGGNITGGGLISNGGITAVGGIGAGGGITGSSVAATGSVSGSTGVFNGGLFSTAVYATIVGGTRTATWTQDDGTMGTSPSSIRFKTNVTPGAFDDQRVLAILSAASRYYNYKTEIARRDDPSSPNYVGPEYHVHLELGYIAEELHALGLWEFVVYERGTDGQPALDEHGDVIPFSVHYELLSIAAIEAAQFLWRHVQSLETDMAAVKAHLGI